MIYPASSSYFSSSRSGSSIVDHRASTFTTPQSTTCDRAPSTHSDLESPSTRVSSTRFTPHRHLARRKRRATMSERQSLHQKSSRCSTFVHFKYLLLSTLLLISFAIGGVSAKPTTTTTKHVVSITTIAATATSSNLASTPSATVGSGGSATLSIPRAFDTSVDSGNFTTPGCLPFFNQFLANTTFINCLPFSFLVKTSKSWFDITKSGLIATTQALDASCAVNVDTCDALMDDYANQLLDISVCGGEFKNRNPTVIQAYLSFITYKTLYYAGCEKDSAGYCYAEAVTNATNIADLTLYYIPLGISIPTGSKLACSQCTAKTMSLYSRVAGNKSQPLYDDYSPAAQLIDATCGTAFVNATVPLESSASSIISSFPSSQWLPHLTWIAVFALFLI